MLPRLLLLLGVGLISICFAEGPEKEDLQKELNYLKKRMTTLEKKLEKQEEEKKELLAKNSFDVFWDNGLHFVTADKTVTLTVGGFAFIDVGFVSEDQAIKDQLDDIDDFAEFRSVRPQISGVIDNWFFFNAEFEFADNDDVAFRNVFAGVKVLPLDGNVKVGFFKESFGLDELTAPPNLTFLETSPLSAFTPAFQLGMAFTGTSEDKLYSFTLGIHRQVEDASPPRVENDGGAYAVTTRITGLPYWAEKGTQFMHFGVAYSARNPLDDSVRFSTRPGIANGPQFADTGVLDDVSYVQLLGLEYALVYKAFSLQAEYMVSWVRRKDAFTDTEEFWGYYVYASYFITGESRKYKKGGGVFVRPKPNKEFLEDGSLGALELAVRYSSVDLNESSNIRGRKLNDIAVVLNWHLTSYASVRVNYIHSLLHNLDDSERTQTNALVFRFQLAF